MKGIKYKKSFLYFLVFANSVSATILQNFNSNFTGKLGSKTEVVFSLKNNNGKLSGFTTMKT
jgi:hypothetical protein